MTNQDLNDVLAVVQDSIDNFEDGQSLMFCKQILIDNSYPISLVRDSDVDQLFDRSVKATQKQVFGRLVIHLFYAIKSNLEK
jgi:hypothetical protein